MGRDFEARAAHVPLSNSNLSTSPPPGPGACTASELPQSVQASISSYRAIAQGGGGYNLTRFESPAPELRIAICLLSLSHHLSTFSHET